MYSLYILHALSVYSLYIFCISSIHLLYIPVRAPLRSRVLPAGRTALQLPPGQCRGPATALALPGQNSNPVLLGLWACYAADAGPLVYGLPDSRISYTFLTVPVLRTDLRSADLCMDISITENDTQLFAKSCVSLSEYAGAIHKTACP